MSELKDTYNLQPDELTPPEIAWLKNFIKFSFKEYVKPKDIIFTVQKGKHLTYYLISAEFLAENGEQSIPVKFLERKYITKGIPNINRDTEFFMEISFIYWCFQNIDDILDFFEIWNEIFYSVFSGNSSSYDKQAKGYRVLPEHFKPRFSRWSAIRKTFLIGFGVFIGLFQRKTVPPLEEIFVGLRNNSLQLIGISKASKKTFGRVAHYGKLHRCWNCGRMIDAPGDLCSDCYDYWDERTK